MQYSTLAMATEHAQQRIRRGGELAQLVTEIVKEVAPTATWDQVLARALRTSAIDTIPDSPEELMFFVFGPLFEETQDEWGTPAAEALLAELAPVLDHAWDRDRGQVLADLEAAPTSSPNPLYDPASRMTSAIQPVRHTSDEPPPVSGMVRASRPTTEPAGPTVFDPAMMDAQLRAVILQERKPERAGDNDSEAPDDTHEIEFGSPVIEAAERASLSLSLSDTIPAPPPDTNITYRPTDIDNLHNLRAADTDDLDLPHDIQHSPQNRTTRRPTLPYIPSVLVPSASAPRILLVDENPDSRRGHANTLRLLGYVVASAPDLTSATALYARLDPQLLVLDIETVAPEYEPLRAAIDTLCGGDCNAKIVLLGAAAQREKPDTVACALQKPIGPDALIDAIKPLLGDD